MFGTTRTTQVAREGWVSHFFARCNASLRANPTGPMIGRSRPMVWMVPLAALALIVEPGCGREFFRDWANQDASETAFEKSRDPRWRLDVFSVEPPAMSRFADPYDPDFPAAPPDDYATQAMSPVPQWPDNRLIIPAEGTGYLDMMEAWRRDHPVDASAPASGTARPANAPPVTPSPSGARPLPGGDGTGTSPSNRNSGTNPAGLTPKPVPTNPPANPLIPGASGPQARVRSQDFGVKLAAFQETGLPMPIPAVVRPRGTTPATPGPLLTTPPVGGDPENLNPDLSRPVNPRPDLTPDQYQASEAMGAEMSGLLIPNAVDFDEAQAAGLPKGSEPYKLTMHQALDLALINSRPYQFQLEQIYIASLAVTLQRFAFQPQFYAGMSPITPPLAGSASGVLGGLTPGFPGVNPINNFSYTTRATGTQTSLLNMGTVAGVGKAFDTGAKIAAGFANQVVFNFVGKNSVQPSVRSWLPLSMVVPFLRGGGRAVTLEPLTQAERNLVYQVRSFAKFRQEFIVSNLVGGNFISFGTSAVSSGFSTGTGGTNEPTTGFVNVLEDLQILENNRRNIAAFEQLYKVFNELKEGESSGLTQLQVDQVQQSLNQARLTYVSTRVIYRNDLDSFKIQIGIPPDTPLMLDRSLTMPFKRVFDAVEEWGIDPRRKLEDLPKFVARFPKLEDVVIDGRSVLEIYPEGGPTADEDQLENLLLAAERVALEHRLDLMNARAQLYDAWRQIRVAANGLKGVFNVSLTNQFITPPATNNPFAFLDQAKQFSLVFNAELPLVRMNERNVFRTALINYQRQRRMLQNAEDTVKLQVRFDIRGMQQLYLQYEIARRNIVNLIRLKDQAFEQIIAPPPGAAAGQGNTALVAAQASNLVSAQAGLIGQENAMMTAWQQFEVSRLQLYRDLGTLPYDEWEALSELFPSEYNSPGGVVAAAHEGPARIATPGPAQVVGRR